MSANVTKSGAVCYRWDDLTEDVPMPLLARKRVIGKQAMLSRVALQKGCDIPTHAHENEQIACVISGSARFGLGALGSKERQDLVVKAGEVLHLPGNVPHSCYALEDCVILDIFSPPSATTGIDRRETDRPGRTEVELPLGPLDFLMTLALPAAVAMFLLLIARQKKWGGPVAILAAFLTVFPWKSVMGGLHVFPPGESLAWSFYVAIAGAIGGILDGVRRWPWWLRALGVFLVGAVCSAITFRFVWSDDRPLLTFACIGFIATICWAALDASEREADSIVAAPWNFWIITASCSVICMMFGGLKQGQLIGAFAAASGAAIVLAYILRRKVFVTGTAMALAIPLALLLASMYLLIDLQPGELPLLIAAGCSPLVMLLSRCVPVRSHRLRAIVRIAPLAIFMLIILALSALKFRQSLRDRDESDDYSLVQTSRSTSAKSRAI